MKSKKISKKLKWFFAVAVLMLVAVQFANPPLQNPPVRPGHDLMATNPPPPEVAALLRQACYDCHSNETRWPWYAHVAPVSWWIVKHMKEGRDKLNFSEWPHEDGYVAGDQLGRIGDQVQTHKMPLPSYTWWGMHPEARLTDEQRGRILKWTEQSADN